jgi:hypothetical protein
MIDYDQYHRNGYVHLRIEDLLHSAEDVEQFNKLADAAQAMPIDNDHYQYILSVKGFHNDPEWPFKTSVELRDQKLEKIKQLNLLDTQRWYESSSGADNLKQQFQNVVKKFIRNFYPEIGENFSNLHAQDAISVYINGDHTQPHRDGQNPGRLCALLMYLTPETQYNNGAGELVINRDESTDVIMKVKPVRGNVVMLDFTKHNPFHAVDPVTNNFIRHCYISFIWNTDHMTANTKPKGY